MIPLETPTRIRVCLLGLLFAIVKSLIAKLCEVFHKYAIHHATILTTLRKM